METEKSDFKLIKIEFTAFNMIGEKTFVNDLTDSEGYGNLIIEDKTLEEAKAKLKSMCYSVVIHRILEYDLKILDKKETTVVSRFEMESQLKKAKEELENKEDESGVE